MAGQINLNAVFEQFTHLEQRYLPNAPDEHDILLILENALLGGEALLRAGHTNSQEHLCLIRNALRIAYEAGKREAT